jgi:hypothetical protein
VLVIASAMLFPFVAVFELQSSGGAIASGMVARSRRRAIADRAITACMAGRSLGRANARPGDCSRYRNP